MNFTLDWSLGAQSITLRLRAATSGWLGVGFSETGHMLGADIVTVSVDATSNITTVTDRNCPWSAMPLQSAPSIFPVADSPQCSQDWGLVCGFGTAAYTEVWITRQLNTGDPQDRQLGTGLTTLIYAWGGSGASLSVDFGTSGATPAFVPPSDTATYVDLNFSTYLTYGVDTQYVCQGFQLDGSQRHVVAVNVLLPSGPFLPLIHHVLVGVALSCGGWCWCDVAVFVVVAFGVHHCVCVCVCCCWLQVHDSGSAPSQYYKTAPLPCQSSTLSSTMGVSVLGTNGTHGLVYGWALGGSPMVFPVRVFAGWPAD